MAANYFFDMKIVLKSFKKHLKPNSVVCIDIGDSIYNKVHIPTDEILIDISKNLKFDFVEDILLRKRLSHSKKPLSQKLIVLRT